MKAAFAVAFSCFLTPHLFAQGCIRGDCVKGEGTFVFSDGSKFIGEFRDSKSNGFGICYYATGETFVGEFKDHAVAGHGAWYYKDGSIEPGFYDATGTFIFYKNLKHGCMQGNCVNGQGTYLWEAGILYTGQFKNSEPDGYGICYFSNGGKYDGQWKERKFNGEVTNYLADGTITRGLWMDHNYVGLAVTTTHEVSSGCISGNCQNGFGVYKYDDGGVYSGEFNNTYREGSGTYFWPGGDKYVGSWKSGSMYGQGTFTYADGRTESGIYEEGKRISTTETRLLKPVIQWEDPVTTISHVSYNTVNLKACIKSESEISRIQVVVNGKIIATETSFRSDPISGCASLFSKPILLTTGKNTVKILAENKAGISYSSDRLIEFISQTRQKRLALLIGNAGYQFANPLKNPANDARAMSQMLETEGFTVMLKQNVTARDLKIAIDQFGKKLKDENIDVGLFYYAGHGIAVKGLNYLVPVDVDIISEEQVEYDCIQADRVLSYMEVAGTDVNVIILDACRNNPFKRSWSRSVESTGLAFMNAPSGTLIAYATAPGHTADDGPGTNGLYTEALLDEMKNPDHSILQVFQRVRARVSEKSGKNQIPWESTSLTGDFYISKSN